MALTRIGRNYFKYSYRAFSQPTLSANGVLGGDSFACAASTEQTAYSRNAWNAFDGNSSTMWSSNTTNSGWIEFYNPNPLKVTSIYWTFPAGYTGHNPAQLRVSGGNLDGSFTTIAEINTQSIYTGSSLTLDLSSNTGYYYIYKFETLGQVYTNTTLVCGEMTITATERITEAGTSSNYDFYEDVNSTYSYIQKVREYYKYSYSSWSNPTLTSNTGNANFKIINAGYGAYVDSSGAAFDNSTITSQALSNAWWCFDNNWSTRGLGYYTTEGYISCIVMVELANPVALSTYQIKLSVDPNNHQYGDNVYAYGSNDGVNWTQIAFSVCRPPFDELKSVTVTDTTHYYKYLAFRDAYGGYDNDDSGIQEIYLTGTQRITGAGTSSDYDYYVDRYKAFSLIKTDGKTY